MTRVITAIVAGIAVTMLSPKRSGADDRPHLSFQKVTEQSQPSAELQSTLTALEPADRHHPLHVLIGIKNVSARPLYFSFLTHDPWISAFNLSPRIPPEEAGRPVSAGDILGPLAGWTHGEGHVPYEGRDTCHVPGDVFMLNPGGELFRDVNIDLSIAEKDGDVDLSVDYALVKVTSGTDCEKAHLLRGRAETEILVRPSRPRGAHAGREPEQSQPSEDLQSTLLALEPADRGHPFRALVGIKNVSDRSLYFSFVEGDSWFRRFGFTTKADPAGGHQFAGTHAIATGSTRRQGRSACDVRGKIFMLKPGGELFRHAEVDLERAPDGKVVLSIEYDLMTIAPGVGCGKARLWRGRAEAPITVRPFRPPQSGGKPKNTG